METYDIGSVLKWALGIRLKTDKIFQTEHAGAVWYIDNYCARAVPTECAWVKVEQAQQGVARTIISRIAVEMDAELHDTGMIRRADLKGKKNICIWKTEDGTEVGVREDYAKLIGKGAKLYAAAQKPAEGAMVVRVGETPVAVLMPVKIRKDGER